MKKIILIILLLIIIIGGLFYFYNNTKVVVNFDLKNVSKIEITQISEEHEPNENQNKSLTVYKSGRIKLEKNTIYSVKYYGIEKFETGYKTINTGENTSISISPWYSNEELQAILKTNINDIHKKIYTEYPKISELYKINDEKIYNFGDWYTAKLKYIGPDIFNSDNLILVMKKENNLWSIVTNPPEIYISSIKYPNIPKNIVDIVSSY